MRKLKYYLDTEFHEFKKKGIDTIDLISIGLCCEDGREYYAICNEFDIKASWANEWLKINVLKPIFDQLNTKMGTYHKTYFWDTTNRFCLKHLTRLLKWKGKSKKQIANEILHFTENSKPVIHAYYADYDWVVFCWLFGRMIDLPEGFPMYCVDLKQKLDSLVDEIRGDIPLDDYLKHIKKHSGYPKQHNEHDALDDAKWNLRLDEFISKWQTERKD